MTASFSANSTSLITSTDSTEPSTTSLYTTEPPLFPVEPQETGVLYTASVGAVIGWLISLTLLVHLIQHYLRTRDNKKTIVHQTAYRLVMLYLSLNLLQLTALLFVRTNIVTRIGPTDFTVAACVSGFTLNWFGSFSGIAMLYIIFIHRIETVFAGSVYEYKPWLLRLLYAVVVLFFFVHAALRTFAYFDESEWVLAEDQHGHLLYCRNKVRNTLQGVSIVLVVYMTCMTSLLLYMFSSRLYMLNVKRIEYFVQNHCHLDVVDEDDGDQETETVDEQTQQQHQVVELELPNFKAIEMSHSTSKDAPIGIELVYDNVRDRRTISKLAMKQEVQLIMDLHNIITKQTILVCVALLSSVILWSLVAWQNVFFWLITWDATVNSICVWLMLKSSKKYWKFCTKYGCCVLCYYKQNAVKLPT